MVESCHRILGPVTLTLKLSCSVSPEQMQILDWDDVLGKKLTTLWNHGTVTFDLGLVTFDPEISIHSLSPERMRILNWYLQG
jgi:hypothetical protein